MEQLESEIVGSEGLTKLPMRRNNVGGSQNPSIAAFNTKRQWLTH